MTGLSDSFQRPINYLRISVTDRCNLRCIYCMPIGGIELIPHEEILSYEEIYTIAQAAAELGISKLRITGGEPLVRLGIPHLIEMLASIKTIDDIAMTTNGVFLADYADELKAAGLKRVNVSLDTLRPERFRQITRGQSELKQVLDGIEAARRAGLEPVKLNMVVMSGINDDELLDFAARTISEEWHVRFIELMPAAGNGDNSLHFLPASEMRRRLEPLGEMTPCLPTAGNGPAKYYRLPDARGTIGFITPVTEHFCFNCNRIRLTADGKLRPCLLSDHEIDIKTPMRKGVSKEELQRLFKRAVAEKPLKHRLAEGYISTERPFSRVGG